MIMNGYISHAGIAGGNVIVDPHAADSGTLNACIDASLSPHNSQLLVSDRKVFCQRPERAGGRSGTSDRGWAR